MKIILLILIIAIFQLPLNATAQGLIGPKETKGGTTAGGTLIPGKSDKERWKLFQSVEKTLLGKSEKDVVKLFGKGGSGFRTDQRLYLITDYKRKKGRPSGTATELEITYVNDKVERYSLAFSHWKG